MTDSMKNGVGDDDLPNLGLLIKLLKMTSSTHDHEALSAIRMANQQLAKFGGDWERLLRGKVTVIGDPFVGVEAPQTPAPATRPAPPAPPRPTPQAPLYWSSSAGVQAAAWNAAPQWTSWRKPSQKPPIVANGPRPYRNRQKKTTPKIPLPDVTDLGL